MASARDIRITKMIGWFIEYSCRQMEGQIMEGENFEAMPAAAFDEVMLRVAGGARNLSAIRSGLRQNRAEEMALARLIDGAFERLQG
jgi:hypothetical protein